MNAFLVPDLGEGLTEAEIVCWLVEEGDAVAVDQPVVEVETAKSTVELPSPYAGTVAELGGRAGEVLAVGALLLRVAPPVAADATGSPEPILVGYGGAAPEVRSPLAASPLVRKLAERHGVALADVVGTGPGGLIQRRDVEQAIKAGQPVSPAPAPRPVERAQSRTRRVTRTVGERLSRSRREVPDATVWVDVDASGLLAARRTLAHEPDRPVSLLALLAAISVAALTRFPELNARVEGDAVVPQSAVDLGFAAQTPQGLLVPVVRNAERLGLAGLARELGRLTASARTGTLTPADASGGSFTLNNYGVFQVDGADAIINHPEVAILGVGRIMDRAWVVDGEVAVRPVTQLCLSFDHRACDGGTAAGFLRHVADLVREPIRLLTEPVLTDPQTTQGETDGRR